MKNIDPKQLITLPVLGSLIYYIGVRWRYWKYVTLWWWNAWRAEGPAEVDPYLMVELDPGKINKMVSSQSFKQRDVGRVVGGDWDLNTEKVANGSLYDGITQRYKKNKSWDETNFFNNQINRIRHTGYAWGCETIDELYDKYNALDETYESMCLNGYRTNQDIFGKGTFHALDEVLVHINRDGDFLFSGEGNHRVRLAKFLCLNSITVRVCVRHEQWQRKRNEIATGDLTPDEIGVDPEHPDIKYLDCRFQEN